MPEGPEIHRAADRIRNALKGQTIQRVEFDYRTISGSEFWFEGEVIQDVEARGKALLIYGPHRVLYAHSQLYGRWMVNKKNRTLPKSTRSLRALFETEHHVVRLFSATDVYLLNHDEVETQPYIAKLGPDVVLTSTTIEEIKSHITSDKYQRRKLSGLLLDQGFLAGIGNYLRSEILFCSTLHPLRTISTCSDEEIHNLSLTVLDIVSRAYQHKGITVPIDDYRSRRKQGLRHGASRHYVFTRSGQPCYECGTIIERHNYASRRIDICPKCQRIES